MLHRCPDNKKSSGTKICYTDDTLPGITRKRTGKTFIYYDTNGKRITDNEQITRLNKIGLPPAYKNTWLCPSPNGHIQAIGYDDKGRKQYRYHQGFSAAQQADKYNSCADFGRSLPLIRARVEKDIACNTLTKDTVVAAIIRLLDLGHVRVGNQIYEKTNNSFGATTLRHRHATANGTHLRLDYRGKSGMMQHMTIKDSRLSSVARRCKELPGKNLFQYIDDNKDVHQVTSNDVNEYIRNTMGKEFSAKDFRTWGANVVAYEALADGCPSLKDMIVKVSNALGNTPAIARKSYLHPAIIELAQGKVADVKINPKGKRGAKFLSPVEHGLISFLEKAPIKS